MITFGGNTDVSIAEFHHGEGDEGTHATLKLLDGAGLLPDLFPFFVGGR